MRVFRLTVIVGILTLFVQCASVPLTGRKQVILLPESEMMQMSLTSYGDFLKENKLSIRTDDTRRVKDADCCRCRSLLEISGIGKADRRVPVGIQSGTES